MAFSGITHIDEQLTLYRNNNEKRPPRSWSNSFKRFNYKKIGDKNKEGFFFLTDSIDIAHDLWLKDKTKPYYLTTCSISQPINIIDFSTCISISQLIHLLCSNDLDILSDDFKTYIEKDGNHIQSFQEYKEDYQKMIEGKGNWLQSQLKMDKLFNSDIGIMGQRLTDFDNALPFYNLIKSNPLALGEIIDGYRWREVGDQRGFTYCFFESGKLSRPKYKLYKPKGLHPK